MLIKISNFLNVCNFYNERIIIEDKNGNEEVYNTYECLDRDAFSTMINCIDTLYGKYYTQSIEFGVDQYKMKGIKGILSCPVIKISIDEVLF